MARTIKRGLDYFPMDIDMFNDLKVRKLIKYQGGKAISVYVQLLCFIYKDGYYLKWDNELPFICSELTGFDEAYISEVIKTCLTLGLFSKDLFDAENVLTSRGIQERYSRICSQSRRVCNIQEYDLLTPKTPKKIKPKSKPKAKKGKEIVTDEQETTPSIEQYSYEPYTLTLDQEIESLKGDECWLDQLQVIHHMDMEALRGKLDEFRLQCVGDGKDRHTSMQDAKHHFNSWLRIVNSKTNLKDDTDRQRRNNQRRGNILKADEPKAYGDTF